MSKKPVKISTVLTRAAKWIDEHGLAKGDYWKHRNGKALVRPGLNTFEQAEVAKEKGCKACIWGALYIGAHAPGIDREDFHKASEQASRYVVRVIGDTSWAIAPWNDTKDRTKEEVVQTLKEAAKAARKDGK